MVDEAPGVMGDNRIAAVARGAGFSGNDLVIAVAVALAESGGNRNAVNRSNSNGTTDSGLWQINSVHAQLLASGDPFQPNDNARMAFTIFTQAGNKWTPWSTYNNRKYVLYMPRAQAAVDMGPASGTVTDPETNSTGLTAVSEAVSALTSADTWRRVALFVAGALLLLITFGSFLAAQLPVGNAIKRVLK